MGTLNPKVLFVITNIDGTYDQVYSFGLASLASIARDKGCDYDYFVINSNDGYAAYLEFVNKSGPAVIAYTAVSSQFSFIREISGKVRESRGNKIVQVCGGVHVTIFPQSVLDSPGLDGIFIGESELAFSDFLDNISRGKDFRTVNNFAYNENGKLRKNELYPLVTDLDRLPFPEREKYHYERFIKRDGYAVFMFSRGCPYSCSYCSNHALAKTYGMKVNKPRYRSPDNCIREINALIERYGIKKIYIGDDTFGIDMKWAEEFCAKYAAEVKLPFICQLRVNLVNDKLVAMLKRAGCVHVNCGVESGSDRVRNQVMKRNISREQIVSAYALFKKYGIASNAINIIGLPGETEKEIEETIALNHEIDPDYSGVNIFYPYRGTELGDRCFEEGVVDEAAYRDFAGERRASILNYSKEFHDRLVDIRNNWEYLVYRPDPRRVARFYLKKIRNFFREVLHGKRN